jgi:hypothetical protein
MELTAGEMRMLKEMAKRARLSMSAWARRTLLGAP